MAHGQEVRDRLRRAYAFNGLSLEVAAAQCGVSFGTARRWKSDAAEDGDDWDKLRAAHTLADGGLEDVARAVLTGLVVQYQATIESVQSAENISPADKVQMLASLADAFNKTVSASKRVLPETSQLATAMDVLQKLGEFVRERYPKHAMAFVEILEPFGEELTRHYGQ
ncbi:DUF1804 family protein [Laribacter hongkongensis]|uniref:DUF1804 family protein n=1 Tax=Laribacter hongkongensis TaxID=168471 RepID=UPI001EFDBC5F|nr:DUF1804 family protein [Laribacter hongkongensis]MCG9086873.1 DUF1804 family protein [Laribacter hongkongensis]